MNELQLQRYVEQVSLKWFNKPFHHQASFNNRLRTTGGRYHIQSHNLDFNPKIIDEFSDDTFLGVVKHELCHYHLHLEGRGYKHGDQDFKDLLKNVGGTRYTPLTEIEKHKRHRWVYQCQGCSLIVKRSRKFNTERFICRNCRSQFKLINEV